MASLDDLIAQLRDLNDDELQRVRAFIEMLRGARASAAWSFDFLAHFDHAAKSASRNPGGMEIRVADATCASITRLALWEHPPVSGSASVGYLVPIPNGLREMKLKFSVGIRDGSELPPDRFIAFRVLVNGFKFWSTVKNTHAWEEHAVTMPQLGSDVARIEFVTDGLGDNRWNWAVWGEPRLEGE
ncbi:MAG: hypothetical protein HY868_00100 [Chloroflexi bacterium]|nr:hypothetical protein [Chloroflexota bacterium]